MTRPRPRSLEDMLALTTSEWQSHHWLLLQAATAGIIAPSPRIGRHRIPEAAARSLAWWLTVGGRARDVGDLTALWDCYVASVMPHVDAPAGVPVIAVWRSSRWLAHGWTTSVAVHELLAHGDAAPALLRHLARSRTSSVAIAAALLRVLATPHERAMERAPAQMVAASQAIEACSVSIWWAATEAHSTRAVLSWLHDDEALPF